MRVFRGIRIEPHSQGKAIQIPLITAAHGARSSSLILFVSHSLCLCVCIMRLWLHLFSSAMTMTMRGGTAKHNSDVHRVLKCSYDISSGAVHRHSAIFALPFRPAIELVSTTHTQTHVRCMHCKCIHECERVPSERIQNHHHRRAT